jgi:hypothetical protein
VLIPNSEKIKSLAGQGRRAITHYDISLVDLVLAFERVGSLPFLLLALQFSLGHQQIIQLYYTTHWESKQEREFDLVYQSHFTKTTQLNIKFTV